MNEIKIEVKTRNEETGDIEFAGFLNQVEVAFLLQYAINSLMAAGVTSEEMRIQVPNGLLQ